jgi:NAD(P)-dependent dehydrogenase (short-subunit alcohol dehydrogenase family)
VSGHVLVVGASRGIGLEFVRQYLADGFRVTATARRDEDVARLSALGATAVALDVADAASVAGLAWQLDGAVVDVALLVAGLYGPRTAGLEAPSAEDFDAVMHANVLGPMRVIQALSDVLAPQARLAVLSSRMGSMGLRGSTYAWLYRASKAAVNSVLKDASLALAGHAVCVAFHPGWVRTDMGGARADLSVEDSVSDMRATLARLTPADNGAFLNHDGRPLPW